MINQEAGTLVKLLWQFIIWLSHKDWELPNSRIWLAEIDIDRGLDFPIQAGT